METRFAASALGGRVTAINGTPVPEGHLPSEKEVQSLSTKKLVTLGWQLDAEIGALQERLGQVKARLVEEAKKNNRAGETVEFTGVEVGHVVSVSFPGDRLVSSMYLDRDGEAIAYVNDEPTKLGKLKEFCGEHFRNLFFESWKPKSKTFRDMAVALLGESKGKKLIAKVSFASPARVSFKTKA